MADATLGPGAVAALLEAGDSHDAGRVLSALARVEVAPDERLELGAGSPADRILTAALTLRADVLWPLQRPLCAAWIGPAGGLFAVPADADAMTLAEGPSWHVTRALAEALGLGPRPRASCEAMFVTNAERLHALLALGDDADAGAGDVAAALELESPPPEDTAPLLELVAARPVHVRVEARWGSTSRALHILDREETPVWLLAEWPGGLLAGGPSTPTALWRGLSTMLPTDDDLAQNQDAAAL